MAIGFSVSDGSVIARAVRHLVGDDRRDRRFLERDLSLLLGEAQGAGMSPAVLSGVLGVMERHGLRPPRALLLLTRTLLTLEATLRLIDPEFDLARPRPRSSSARRARVLGHAGGDPAPRAHPRAAGAAQSPGARRDPGRSATGRAPGPALRALCRRGPAGGPGL